jgi:glutathione S-transferase
MPPFTAIVTVAIVIEYWAFAGLVTIARYRTGIRAPAMVGHPDLEHAIRVHLNTLEKLAIVVPAAATAAAWAATRILYAVGYLHSPRGRTVGAILGDVCEAVLVALAGYGAFQALR